MLRILRPLSFLVVLLPHLTRDASAQVTHDILLKGDPVSGQFSFTPSRTTAAPGDLLRFVVSGGQPHAIAFDGSQLAPPVRAALDAALVDHMSDLRGPLLTAPVGLYRMIVPSVPAGDYIFFCLTHLSYRMTGVLTVTDRNRSKNRP